MDGVKEDAVLEAEAVAKPGAHMDRRACATFSCTVQNAQRAYTKALFLFTLGYRL